MKLFARFFSSFYISLLCVSISVSYNVSAIQTDPPERWFEVEVILFNQLSDKSVLKEQFSDTSSSSTLPQYKKYFDLITPHIQPNLTGIKQFMPLCSEKDTQIIFQPPLPYINTPFADALNFAGTLNEIEHYHNFSMSRFTTENKSDGQHGNDDSLFSIHQKQLVLELQDSLTTPLFSTQEICIVSRADIKKLYTGEQLANFQLDAFDVEALPSKLNALGTHISDRPYLISDESLLLTDIYQRLQSSNQFKPFLHFGWRQVGITQNKAIPLKMFAGKHLENQYQQALNNYLYSLNETKQAEQFSSQQLTFQQTSIETQEIDNKMAQIAQENRIFAEIKQQKLTQILKELDTIDDTNIKGLIGDFKNKTLEELITINENSENESELSNISNRPIEPIQPWFLNGFFKVHLDHYLYITADFNMVSQPEVKSETNSGANNTEMKLINFSQNKRAITGEIHYFDHPYIGMIVQIRRFDPSKPIEEAVTQVIN